MVTHSTADTARNYLLVAIGGMIGALARYAVGNGIDSAVGNAVLGTFVANISGAFLLGFVSTVGAQKLTVSLDMRRFIGVGILGSYTTFSVLSHQTLQMLESGNLAGAAANGIGSLLAGLLAVAAGVWLARR